MSQTRQPSLSEVTNERPQTGCALDERTHYAHTRYAATEHGVIWYDPRDGHEYLTLDVAPSLDSLDVGSCSYIDSWPLQNTASTKSQTASCIMRTNSSGTTVQRTSQCTVPTRNTFANTVGRRLTKTR